MSRFVSGRTGADRCRAGPRRQRRQTSITDAAPIPATSCSTALAGPVPISACNLGYAWGSVANNPTKPSGFVGGVQAGYNWQNGSRLCSVSKATSRRPAPKKTFAPWKFSNPWFGTVRGRAGYAFNNILFFGTGGLAFGELRATTFGLSDPRPMRAGRSAPAPRWASPGTGAPRSNTSMSIWPTATSSLQARQTATGSA